MPCNVLITAASRRVALVQAFQRALAARTGGRVIVTDINPLSPAVHVADRAYLVPLSSSPDYLDEIWSICDAEDVRLVVPTIDDELELFAAAQEPFARRGVAVARVEPGHGGHLQRQVRDLHAPAGARRGGCRDLPAGSPCRRRVRYPLFVKPRVGRGGVGAYRARTPRELAFFLDYVPGAVVQEYLDGPEFTIDVLCDDGGRVLSVVPRERVVIRAGVIDRGRTVQRHGADRPRAGLRRGAAVCRRRQHPVPRGQRPAGDLRDQPAILGRDPPDHRGRRGLSRDAARPGGRRDASQPAIGAFQPDFWMTSYEASFFLDDDRVAALRTSSGPERLGEVA